MMGGAGLIGSFLDAGEIDEFVIHVIPTFIGEGIPLIAPKHRSVSLDLRSSRRYPDGVVRLHYSVVTSGSNLSTNENARSSKRLHRPKAQRTQDIGGASSARARHTRG